MSKDYRKAGFRQQATPTKNELIQKYDARIAQIEGMLQQIVNMSVRMSEETLHKVQNIVDVVDYRSLAMMRILSDEKRKLFTMEELEATATALRLEDFDKQSAADDKTRGLVDLPTGSKAKLGDWLVFSFQAVDVASKQSVLHSLRSKCELGKGDFNAIEKELIGLGVGDKKQFVAKLGPEFAQRELAGKEVEFSVEIFAVKAPQAKPATIPEPKATLSEISTKE